MGSLGQRWRMASATFEQWHGGTWVRCRGRGTSPWPAAWSQAGRVVLGGEQILFLSCSALSCALCDAWCVLAMEAGAEGTPLCTPASRRAVKTLGFVLFGSAPALKSPRAELFKASVCFPASGTPLAPSRAHRDPRGAPRHRFPPRCPPSPSCPLLPGARLWGRASSCEER